MLTVVPTGPKPSTALRPILAVVAAVVLSLVAPVASNAQEAREGGGLEVSSTTYYDPRPAAERIEVGATYTLTNRQPDEIDGNQVRSFFYTKWIIALPAAVTDFAAASDGRLLEVEIQSDPDSKDIVFASMALPYDLQYEQTLRIDVSYTIPGSAPRVEGSIARVNDSFLSFAVWTAGDPGMADVRIRVPDGFRIDLQGGLDELQEVERNGQTVLEAVAIASPQNFFGQVFGRNDDGLITASADLPDGRATVRAWPDDPAWAEFVVDAIEDDVPVMADLIGIEWAAGDIEVIETVTPYLFGYGGWFNASSGLIEIGETLERDLILHELSHAWFNDDLIDGRWITEGLAEEFASRTMEATGDVRPDPIEPDLGDPVRVPLASWASPWTLPEEDAFAYEQYHYNASWWVIRTISDEIGLEQLAEVLRALHDDALTYPGERPGEETIEPTQWIHLFDLLDEHIDDHRLDELFITHVLEPVDAARLTQRRLAREEYDELVEASGSWSPPVVVRRHLASWRFDDATRAIEAAASVLEARDSVDDIADGLEVRVEHPAETAYEDANTVEKLEAVLADELRLLDELVGIRQRRDALATEARRLHVAVVFEATTSGEASTELAVLERSVAELDRLRTTVETRAAASGLTTPAWERAGRSDVDDAVALAEARLATLQAIEATARSIGAPRSPIERFGLLSRDPNDLLDSARRAYEADRLDVALATAAEADAVLADASRTGRSRLTSVAAGAAVVLLLGVTFAVVRGQRRPLRKRTSDREDPA